ncbi:MAG: serine hydroxymethyltransferase [Candidatus Paceibacterota bacterium]
MKDKKVEKLIKGEKKRQAESFELIPSENYVSEDVLTANGSIFTNKYAEGYPGKRYYGGQEFTDQLETLAIERAKKLFRCDHANVQALSGSPMNQAVYLGLMKPGDTIMGMDLSHGGHLTHGAPVSHMGKLFNFIRYKTHPENGGKIDFEELMALAKKHKPKIILCGYTSYPRDYKYEDFKRVADAVGAFTMADIAHVGGLVAAGVMANPFDAGFDIVTTTTHKTLRGPRGGLILTKGIVGNPLKEVPITKENIPTVLDRSIFPGLQGGPHMQTIAGIAVALGEAAQPKFKKYAKQVLINSKKLAARLMKLGVKLVTDGTDNHMMVIDCVKSFNMLGGEVEKLLDEVGITTNKSMIPDDPNPPFRPSGLRLGTPAMTTRGLKEKECERVAELIVMTVKNKDNKKVKEKIRKEIKKLAKKFPIPKKFV